MPESIGSVYLIITLRHGGGGTRYRRIIRVQEGPVENAYDMYVNPKTVINDQRPFYGSSK